MRFDARQIAGLCNGSTPDSDSVCEGSNPSPAAKKTVVPSGTAVFLRKRQGFERFDQLFVARKGWFFLRKENSPVDCFPILHPYFTPNPSPAAKQKAFHICNECGTLSLFSWFSPASLFPVEAVPLCCSSRTIYTNHQLKCATHILIAIP